MQKIYLLAGCPGVGKSWLTKQLLDAGKYTPIEHDEYRDDPKDYIRALIKAAKGNKPVIANTPFGVSEIMADIDQAGAICVPVFVVADEEVVKRQYFKREGKLIPPGHLTRQKTYMKRAFNLGAFMGTSDQVLKHLMAAAEIK